MGKGYTKHLFSHTQSFRIKFRDWHPTLLLLKYRKLFTGVSLKLLIFLFWMMGRFYKDSICTHLNTGHQKAPFIIMVMNLYMAGRIYSLHYAFFLFLNRIENNKCRLVRQYNSTMKSLTPRPQSTLSSSPSASICWIISCVHIFYHASVCKRSQTRSSISG